MVPPMDQEEVEGAMDQEAVDGAMDGTTDGSGSSQRSDEWYYRWIRKKSKERSMEPPMDRYHKEVEGAMDGTTDGSERSQRNDG